MNKMPPLYKCEVCGVGLDPKGGTVLKLVTGWVKGTGRNIIYLEENHYRFIHEVCRSKESSATDTLF